MHIFFTSIVVNSILYAIIYGKINSYYVTYATYHDDTYTIRNITNGTIEYRHFDKNSIRQATKSIISVFNLYLYFILLYYDEYITIRVLLGYYAYDTIRCLVEEDALMFAHHLLTVFFILNPSNDKEKILQGLYMLKIGDLFIYWEKIIKNLFIPMQRYGNLICLFTNSVTLVLWLLYRVIYCFDFYPFYHVYNNILAGMLHAANVVWFYKLLKLELKYINLVMG